MTDEILAREQAGKAVGEGQGQDHAEGLTIHLPGLLRTIYTQFLEELFFCTFYIKTLLKKDKEMK